MATTTSSANLTALAIQLYEAAAKATSDADRNALLTLATKHEEQAAQRRPEEMAEDAERRTFWASRAPMNWVS